MRNPEVPSVGATAGFQSGRSVEASGYVDKVMGPEITLRDNFYP